MGKSKQETKQQQTVAPTNPAFVTGAVTNQQQRIEGLGRRDPREFVAPASQLQNAAFSLGGGLANRMSAPTLVGNAATGQMTSQPVMREPVAMPAPAPSPSGDFITNPSGAALNRDFSGYVRENQDVQQEYNGIRRKGFRSDGVPMDYDFNRDGKIQTNEFGQFHFDKYGSGEGREVGLLAGAQAGVDPRPQVAARQPVTGAAVGQVGATELSGPNPNDFFTGAGLLAGNVGTSGPNLGQATGYDAAGYDASGYSAALMNLENMRGRDVASMQAQSLLTNLDDYMNPYLDDVVDTTLAGYDRQAGAREAAYAAQGAGRGAFGGSRHAIGEAELAGLNGLYRAQTEAGLRSDAFNTGAQLSGQDADRRQSASAANAQFQNDAFAQEYGLYGEGLLANAGYANDARRFTADAQNVAGQFNANSANDANRFTAGSANDMSMFNAGQADNNLTRQLQAAGLLGDLGSTVGAEDRANIGLLSGLGNEQREIDRAYRNAEPTMAELLGQLNAQQQFSLFRGENSNSNTTRTEQGSTLDQIGQAVGIATALGGMMPGGGGGKAKGKF